MFVTKNQNFKEIISIYMAFPDPLFKLFLLAIWSKVATEYLKLQFHIREFLDSNLGPGIHYNERGFYWSPWVSSWNQVTTNLCHI